MTLPTSLPVAFQGETGANSDIASHVVFPDRNTLPCVTFDDAFSAVREERASYAMIPIDNSIAGRVADIQRALAELRFVTDEVEVLGVYPAHPNRKQ